MTQYVVSRSRTDTKDSLMERTDTVKKHLSSGGCGGDVCTHCNGSGMKTEPDGSRPGMNITEDCYRCRGSGM